MDQGDLTKMRRSYERAELLEDTVERDPISQLRRWLDDAIAAGALEPNAMNVATCEGSQPSSRMVLLRGLDQRGLVFYTSYTSRKGRELAANPHAAVLFYWPQLERQARIEGSVEPLSEEESDAYFASRPRGHQIGAWASEQSETVEEREVLDQRVRDFGERFDGQDVPRPHSWGGLLVRPVRFEFWQGRPNRMHDRLEYQKGRQGWSLRRLQP